MGIFMTLEQVKLLLGHTKIEMTGRNLGNEVKVALEMAEQTKIGFAS